MIRRMGPEFTALLCSALVLLLLCGCYTRLTTPKETIHYLDPDGKPLKPDNGTVAILAPEYNRALRELGIDIGEYRMAPGTRVTVEVWGHGINATVNIRPDGRIDLPLIGDVVAEDKTIGELKDHISQLYQEFYAVPPQVILNTDSGSLEDGVYGGDVTVINPTGRGGIVNLTGDEKLSQILGSVSALGPKSEWNEVAVIRKGRKEPETYVVISDMEKLLRYGDLAQDVQMRNGDIVFVPHEQNTLLQEIFASLSVLADNLADQETILDYIDRLEAY